jgi:hypothetical protein
MFSLQTKTYSATAGLLDDDVAVRKTLLGRHLGATAATTTIGIDSRAMSVSVPIVTVAIVVYANPHSALAD